MLEMTSEEKWLFDLQGYLLVRDVLSREEVAALNASIDQFSDRITDDGNATVGESKSLRGERPRQIISGLLQLPQPWCRPFRDLLVHRGIIPYLNTMLGRGWRMDHAPACFIADKGAAGLLLHGSGMVAWHSGAYYAYTNGRMRCAMVAIEFALTDVGEGDGGFCVVPGSHKANLPAPRKVMEFDEHRHVVTQVPHRAGDMIIFNEATIHGTLPWTASHQRRALLYRYSPKVLNYAGGFQTVIAPDWFDELTEAQRSVLEPPYLYNRELIEDDGSLTRPMAEY